MTKDSQHKSERTVSEQDPRDGEQRRPKRSTMFLILLAVFLFLSLFVAGPAIALILTVFVWPLLPAIVNRRHALTPLSLTGRYSSVDTWAWYQKAAYTIWAALVTAWTVYAAITNWSDVIAANRNSGIILSSEDTGTSITAARVVAFLAAGVVACLASAYMRQRGGTQNLSPPSN